MESFLLAVVVSVAVWLFLRRSRMLRQRRTMQRQPAKNGGEGLKSMPRMGTPGTITRAQQKALQDAMFEPSRHWSREEAQLILESLTYLRAAIAMVTGDRDAPLEVQNKVLQIILGDDELRNHVLDWSRNRTRDQESGETMELERDAPFEHLAAFIDELWEDNKP